jgi:hypothetical protein
MVRLGFAWGMRANTDNGRIRTVALIAGAALLVAGAAGCGKKDFERRAKPPVPIQLSGVITSERVTVSPDRFGSGPIVLLISNQTEQSHTVALEGQGIKERVGPINPGDTATLQKTLEAGGYLVKAGSERALPKPLAPARLSVGRRRPTSEDFLTYP